MVKQQATVKNSNGIHVRPSQAIASSVAGYEGVIQIESEHQQIHDANTISIISLGLIKGDHITVTVEGPDEAQICERLVKMFELEFDFPPRN
jgi:phosphocarrier protein